jgi:ABC-2 type transport system permease protein
MTQIVFSSAYGIAFAYVTDLHRNRFINYQLTLPMPKTFLFGEFIFIFMIEIFFISLPLIIAGSLFLGPLFPLHHANWFLIIAMYLLSLLFFSLLFIYLAFNTEYTWFLDNVWARRLTPLFLLGCSFFTWKKLYAFNKTLGTLFLCNPLTYIHEGLRGAFLGQENFLPFWICFGMTLISCTLLVLLLSYAIKKRLDPV